MKTLFKLGLLLFFALQANAQTYRVSGKVTDQEIPLADVSVHAKGKSTGTYTNQEGLFELQLPKGSYTLVFTFGNKKEVEHFTDND